MKTEKINEQGTAFPDFEEFYMNHMQIMANLIDPNILICEDARAAGKTEGVMTPRIIRVANSMPGELAFLVHKTYVALMTNVWPNIAASFARPVQGGSRSMLQYGIDYVVGETKLPSHFKRPKYPITYPKHSIIFRNGFHLQMVSSDQPESVAGRSGVHAFIEEMKHNRGEKLKSRLFPSLRGSSFDVRQCPYYQGITGVSDTARVDLGEDDWFYDYENNVDQDLIDEIATVSAHVNKAMLEYYQCRNMQPRETNPVKLEKLRMLQEQAEKQIKLWQPRLNEMRKNSTFYIRASSFVNKDILGPKFFKTQLDTLDTDEFLTSICAIRMKSAVNRFFAYFNKRKHQFSDSYKYESILKLDLKDKFILTAEYLKWYNPDDELILGYDPGHFSSLVVAQDKPRREELRVIKNFTCFYPAEQPELARQFYDFFGSYARNKRIILFHDRAANKTREEYEQITTDARALKRELESYGFTVELRNEGQSVIYHWQQFKLMQFIFSGRTHSLPTVIVDENVCNDLCSSIMLSPRKDIDGRVQLDKTSERKVPLKMQAGLTTQLASAFIYMLYGLYGDQVSSICIDIPDDLPDNITLNL